MFVLNALRSLAGLEPIDFWQFVFSPALWLVEVLLIAVLLCIPTIVAQLAAGAFFALTDPFRSRPWSVRWDDYLSASPKHRKKGDSVGL